MTATTTPPTSAAPGPRPAEEPRPAAPEAPAQPILAVENVTLAYGRKVVLRDVNLRVHAGDFWCLLGSNGEGKSTLLKALLGAVKPSRGRILLRADFARRTRIGLVPQESEVNTALPTTVSELVLTGTVGLSLDSRSCDSRLRRVLDLMGLQRQRHSNFWTLSGGQRQRTLVARALIRDPLLLIVDEPTAGLDLAAASGLLETITSLSRDKGITILFVTHDLGIAAQRATHIALFKSGRLVAGPTSEVFTPSNLRDTFGVPVEVLRDGTGSVSVRVVQKDGGTHD
ncbi:MAG: ABC transporter ATP-binding protein [Verrucomicrobia bacterium]|nr:ABC transporter ATP-binding protein [Verrucomicrobiota bacterium]